MSGSEEGENRSRRDRQDKNEARRAGDWEMVLSTSKSTGDWFGSSGGRRQVSESIIKNGKGCTVQICVELRVVELIEWIGQVQRQSRGKKKTVSLTGERRGDQCACGGVNMTGELLPPGDRSVAEKSRFHRCWNSICTGTFLKRGK